MPGSQRELSMLAKQIKYSWTEGFRVENGRREADSFPCSWVTGKVGTG